MLCERKNTKANAPRARFSRRESVDASRTSQVAQLPFTGAITSVQRATIHISVHCAYPAGIGTHLFLDRRFGQLAMCSLYATLYVAAAESTIAIIAVL